MIPINRSRVTPFNPASSDDAIYFNDLELGSFTRLDQQLYERIQMGAIRF